MKIVIFGYSEFTRRCVLELQQRGMDILLLCPECDRELFASYGMHEIAVQQLIFHDMDDPVLLDALRDFSPDYLFSIIFSHLVPDHILSMARHGSVNFHPAPLPAFRTANAWFWPLRHGAESSALCLHHMTSRWDSGDLVLQVPFSLSPLETQGTYVQKVCELAPAVVQQLMALMNRGPLPRTPQGKGRYYGKVTLGDIFIDFNEGARGIEALVRACNPFHYAQTMFRDKNIEIVEADLTGRASDGVPGSLLFEDGELYCAAADELLHLRILQVPMEGTFSGRRFALQYGVNSGERLRHICEFPQFQHLLQ